MKTRGRPRVPDEDRKSRSFMFMMTEELYDKLEQYADTNNIKKSEAARVAVSNLVNNIEGGAQ